MLCIGLIVLMIFGTIACTQQAPDDNGEVAEETSAQIDEQVGETTRTIIDLADRTLSIPVKPARVATMQGPTYEMVFMLGGKDQIALVREDHTKAYPLAKLTNPDIVNYPNMSGVGPDSPVNAEEYLNHEVDLVVYWNIEQELEKFDNAGIPAMVVNWSSFQPTNIEECLGDTKKQLSVLADALGGEAVQRYKEWEKYFDNTVVYIQSRIAKIDEKDYPTVYWANSRGTNLLSTFPMNPKEFEVALCGGKLVSVEKGGQFPEINKEQLLGWEPQVILVDNHGRNPEQVIDELKTGQDWKSMPAVKNDRIYRMPSGVFFLDKGTSRPVFYYWLAKQLHPDLFEELDLVKELKYYFTTFYDYDLTTGEAENVIAGWIENQ